MQHIKHDVEIPSKVEDTLNNFNICHPDRLPANASIRIRSFPSPLKRTGHSLHPFPDTVPRFVLLDILPGDSVIEVCLVQGESCSSVGIFGNKFSGRVGIEELFNNSMQLSRRWFQRKNLPTAQDNLTHIIGLIVHRNHKLFDVRKSLFYIPSTYCKSVTHKTLLFGDLIFLICNII